MVGFDDDLGRVAYTAYCERQGWKSFSNDQLPGWDDVRLDIKLAWIAAAVSAVEWWRVHESLDFNDQEGYFG